VEEDMVLGAQVDEELEEEEYDFELSEEALPTPRNPDQTFFNLSMAHPLPHPPADALHRYVTGEDMSPGPTSVLQSSPHTIPSLTFTTPSSPTGVEAEENADIDCGASISTQPSTALSSPSTSTTSLPTSTAPSEAASSVCGDQDADAEREPSSDDTATPYPFLDGKKVRLGVFGHSEVEMGSDFEVDAY